MNDVRPESIAELPVALRLPVQWGEQDALGHVNNVVYFRWFESARIEYLNLLDIEHIGKQSQLGPILAATTCNYRRQIHFPDTVWVTASVDRVGRSSMVVAHTVYSERRAAIVAEGTATTVLFDYVAQRPVRIPGELLKRLEQIEGRSFTS